MSIISFKHKFIFVKTKKVAGTSVEAALRAFTGPEDIVPCVTPRDELYSALRGEYSKNYAYESSDEKEYTRLVLERDFDGAMTFLQAMEKKYVSHMDATRLMKVIKEHGYLPSDFRKFTIERHPYSWVISSVAYNNSRYNKGTLLPMEVKEIRRLVARKLKDQQFIKSMNWNMFTSNDALLVDEVIKFEDLETGLRNMLNDVGIDTSKLELPNLKANVRHLDPYEVLDAELRDQIHRIFRKTFEAMGYAR